jgi:hypothetical protein
VVDCGRGNDTVRRGNNRNVKLKRCERVVRA